VNFQEVLLIDINLKEGFEDIFLSNLYFQDGIFKLNEIYVEDVVLKQGDPFLKHFILDNSILNNIIQECKLKQGSLLFKENAFSIKVASLDNVIFKNTALI
jgi:hypothetical protein